MATGIFSPDGRITGTEITINASGDKLLIAGNANDYTTVLSGAAANAATYNLSNVTLTNKGTLQLGTTAADSFTFTGGSMNNTGIVIVNADELNVTDDYFSGLFTKEGESHGKLNFSGNAINVDGAVDLNELGIINDKGDLTENFTLEDSATLTADTISLDSAYKVGNLSLDAGKLNIVGNDEDKNKFIFSSGTITVRDVLNGATENDRVVIKAESDGDTAKLNLSATDQGKITNVDRIHAGWSWQSSGDSYLNVDGTWDFGGLIQVPRRYRLSFIPCVLFCLLNKLIQRVPELAQGRGRERTVGLHHGLWRAQAHQLRARRSLYHWRLSGPDPAGQRRAGRKWAPSSRSRSTSG